MEDVLVVKNLKTQFFIYEGVVKALEDVSFSVGKGEVLGIVGETGCGKSVTAYSITRLIPDPPGRVVGGEVRLGNLDLMRNIKDEARFVQKKRIKIKHNYRVIRNNELFFNTIRGKYISMIFQEPMAALNPVYTVEDQIAETLLLHNRTRLLKIMKSASGHLSELEKWRDGGEIEIFDDELGEEIDKIKKTARGVESIRFHQDLLIEGANGFSKKMQKYEEMLKKSIEHDELEDRLLTDPNPTTQQEIIKRLAKESKKVNLIKMSKQMKRNKKDPLLIEGRRESFSLLESVDIPNPRGVLKSYPHELSGGMLQRVTISIALANNPKVLIADEPTTALDVTVQAQILKLLRDLQDAIGTSIILITHDLGVIAETCNRVAVMYAGNIVEMAEVKELFRNPKHPYTIGLLQSIPRVDDPNKTLKTIPGNVPNLINPPQGCRFHPRCPFVFDRCRVEKPVSIEVSKGHTVECHLFSGKVNAE